MPQVDDIPLSRPKRNISRDFADGGTLLKALGISCYRRAPTAADPSAACDAALPASQAPHLKMLLFCPAVLLAEVVANYFPKLVELHNYRCAAVANHTATVQLAATRDTVRRHAALNMLPTPCAVPAIQTNAAIQHCALAML